MSRSSGTQSSTTVSEPPSYLRPFLQQGAQGAAGLYNRGGTPVVGFAPETQAALGLTTQRALAGSPVNQAAQNLATQTLQGGFMGANPYIEDIVNRSSGSIIRNLQGSFGLAGRNVGGRDAAGLAADRMIDLNAAIRAPLYESERARQQQTMALSPQLASQDYLDFGQLANVGAQREALEREQVGQPGRALDEYLARLQGFPGGTVTQSIPTERNILGGALAGAGAGSMFGPWGTLIGGGLGAIFG